MARIESWFDQDIKKPVKVHHIGGNMFSQDNLGNLIGVRVFDHGEAVTLSGSVSANVIRPDGGTVAVAGTLSDNTASVELPQAAYAYPGMIAVVLKLTSGSAVTTLCAVTAIVYRSTTDVTIDPGTIVPSIQNLIAQIDAAVASIPLDYSALNQEVSDIKSALNQLQVTIDLFDPAVVGSTVIKGYILTNVAVGETVPLVADNTNNSYRHIVRHVKKGDMVTITGRGTTNSLLWVFTDENAALISKSASDAYEASPVTLSASADGYVVSNFLTSYDYSMILTTSDLSENIDYVLDDVTEETDYTDKLVRGYIDASGTTVSTAVIDNAGMRCIVVPVKTGDELTITGNGGNASRLWCFIDEQFNVISVAPPTAQEANIHHKAPTDGYVICNFDNNKTKKIVIRAIKTKHETLCESWLTGTLGSANQNVGDLFDGGNVTQNTQYHRQIIRIFAGEKYKITANGGSSGRAYYVLDDNFIIKEVAPELAYTKSYSLTVESNGYLIVNALVTRYNAVIKLHSADRNNQIIPLAYPPDYPDVITSVTFNSTVKMSYAEILAGYDALLQAYPDNITKTTLGLDASETYTIYRYDFYPTIPYSDRASGGFGVIYDRTNYPVVSLDACIHGNEHPCGRALLNFMTAVCEEKNATLAWLHDNIHFVVIPITNPWGYEHDDRKNSNGVDLNRNFPALWGLGATDPTDGYYRGTEPFSEPETEYLASILNEIVDKNSFCLSYHTHGRFEDYRSMTCWAYANYGNPDPLTSAGYEVIRNITRTGHNNHNLPADSGLIGRMQCGSDGGSIMNYGSAIGLPTVTPECMYRYYDGGITADYNTNTNTMNAEYIEICVLAMVKRFLYQ